MYQKSWIYNDSVISLLFDSNTSQYSVNVDFSDVESVNEVVDSVNQITFKLSDANAHAIILVKSAVLGFTEYQCNINGILLPDQLPKNFKYTHSYKYIILSNITTTWFEESITWYNLGIKRLDEPTQNVIHR